MTRKKTPSRAVVKGGSLGTGIGAVIDVAAALGGYPLPPGSAAALGGSLAMLFAYFTRGGRQGEPD